MNAPLYTIEILRLAAALPGPVPLTRVDGEAEHRSPTCGSVIRTEVQLARDGTVAALSQQVQACAFGQASAALVAAGAPGRNRDQIASAADDLMAWLGGGRADPGDWPGLVELAPARSRTGRRGAILLPFQALLAAMNRA